MFFPCLFIRNKIRYVGIFLIYLSKFAKRNRILVGDDLID